MVHGPHPAATAGIIDPHDGRHPAGRLEPDGPGERAGGRVAVCRSEAPLILRGSGIERELRCRVLQSPLAGVSDRIFRGLVRRWAPEALLFTEMVNATGLELGHGRGKVEDLADEAGPIGVQLFDHRPGAMAEAARRAEASGAFLIDINMGCPVRKIARKGGGSGLIREPELAARIVEAVAAAVSVPVTVKTRLAWCGSPGAQRAGDQDRQAEVHEGDAAGDGRGDALDATSPGHDEATRQRALRWCRQLQDAGAQLLSLHGRTREQGFGGRADWEAIGTVKRALRIPVIANGDVRGPEEARRCLAISGADGVMVGRASMGAPWMVGRIAAALSDRPLPAEPGARERIALAAEQLEALLEAYGPKGLLIARKHLGWTCQGFAGAAELRHALMRAPTAAEAFELLARADDRLAGAAATAPTAAMAAIVRAPAPAIDHATAAAMAAPTATATAAVVPAPATALPAATATATAGTSAQGKATAPASEPATARATAAPAVAP